MAELPSEEQMRQRSRERYPEHFGHAWNLYEFAHGVLENFKGSARTPYEISTWLICGKAFKSYYAVLYLCEVAHTEDAGIILRSLFNLLVIHRWISAENQLGRASRYLGWFWVVMHEQLDSNQAKVTPEMAGIVERQYEAHKRLRWYPDKEGKPKIRKKWHEPEAAMISDMADQVQLGSHYERLYKPLSSIEHSDALAYFAMVSQMETKDGGPSLALHSDLFVPAYVRNAFQCFADILRMWNSTHGAFEPAKLDEIVNPAMEFFKKEVGEQP